MFQALNDDLLIQLFEQLRPEKGLRALSSTCRWLREAAIPILFKRCGVEIYTSPLNSRHFPPTSLWPYVRHLSLLDNCQDAILMDKLVLRHTKDHLVCGVFGCSFLKEALQAMPNLFSVTVRMDYDVLHGLCWESFKIFLSLPHLREFFVDGFSFCPRRFPQVEARAALGSLAPLTSFRVCQDVSRRRPRSYPSERDALVFVIGKLHSTLESLELPIESAPLDVLSSLFWPRLRELKLLGECPDVGLPAPLASVFSNMPKLRVLALHFALPDGMSRPLISPRGYSTSLAFNELTHLSISFPNPDDALYDSLPQTLRHLSLRCSPHHCLQHWDSNNRIPRHWHSPILSASELIQILRRCNTSSLDYLQVEYIADGTDPHVLSTMASAFPVLKSLEMSRFREPSGNDVSIPDISQSLASLSALRSLSLHLDFSDVPQVAAVSERRGMYYLSKQHVVEFRGKLRERASLLLRGLGRPLEELWLLQRGDWPCAQWLPFRVVHGSSDLSDEANVVYDQHRCKSIVFKRF